MSSSLDLVAINVAGEQAMANDGTLLPITNWFDEEGDECAPDHAVTAVAGIEGAWFAFRLDDFGDRALS
jgi:hypothetical protein